MKIIKSIIIITILILFSFYYTNKTANLIKQYDPIMIKIKEESSKYKIKPVSSITSDNTIILGKVGLEIDIDKSYSKMKKNNEYSANLLVFNKIQPQYNYSSYITNKVNMDNKLSLVFTPANLLEINILEEIVATKQVALNIFINKELLTNNYNYFKNLNKLITINNYDYNNFLEVSSLINNIKESKLCLLTNQNKELLNICSSNKMHTILPTIIENYSYLKIKEQLNNNIFLIKNVNYEDLIMTINYLKSRGYDIVELKELLEL